MSLFSFFVVVYFHFLVLTTRLSTVGQEEGGPSWSSLHGGADSGPEENALHVEIKFSMMVNTIDDQHGF